MKNLEKTKNIKTKLIDKTGYFKKCLQIKRLAKYANEIDTVLTRFNKKSCNETMMIKGVRKSREESTNRKTHTEDLEKIVAQIAKGIGLNEDIVKLMGKHHDVGHTFSGHSGEWWISNILDDYGLGCFCHNTLGAKELIYTDNVYEEIMHKIKVHNPNISSKQECKIRNSLWLIMDAINAHNGEKPEKEFIPVSNKTEEDFVNEILNCYSIPGYDRTIMPATPEACLMRLADKISYIPLDMVDGLKEGLIRDKNGNIVETLDSDYAVVLSKIGITKKDFDSANLTKDYRHIAERLKEIFINDVIQNSSKHKIKMSKEMTVLMGQLLTLNNEKAVNNVILVEDQQTYPACIRSLMNTFSYILIKNGIVTDLHTAFVGNQYTDKNAKFSSLLEKYHDTPYFSFIEYLSKINSTDYNFVLKIIENASKQSIKSELTTARQCVQKMEDYKPKEEFGYNFDRKNDRIKSYISYYSTQLELGNLVGYTDETLNEEVQQIYNNMMYGRYNKNYLLQDEQIAMMLSAQYISSLNDVEFINLLYSTNLITEEQVKSLTRKYKDIPNLKDEVYEQKNWKVIKNMQMEAAKKGEEEVHL